MGLWRNAEYVAVLTLMKGDSVVDGMKKCTYFELLLCITWIFDLYFCKSI